MWTLTRRLLPHKTRRNIPGTDPLVAAQNTLQVGHKQRRHTLAGDIGDYEANFARFCPQEIVVGIPLVL
jgi:hypothetical protein